MEAEASSQVFMFMLEAFVSPVLSRLSQICQKLDIMATTASELLCVTFKIYTDNYDSLSGWEALGSSWDINTEGRKLKSAKNTEHCVINIKEQWACVASWVSFCLFVAQWSHVCVKPSAIYTKPSLCHRGVSFAVGVEPVLPFLGSLASRQSEQAHFLIGVLFCLPSVLMLGTAQETEAKDRRAVF